MEGMTNAETIHRFLVDRAPAAFCDNCIAKQAAVAESVANVVAMAFGLTSDFQRTRGKCSACQRDKLVTRFRDGRGSVTGKKEAKRHATTAKASPAPCEGLGLRN